MTHTRKKAFQPSSTQPTINSFFSSSSSATPSSSSQPPPSSAPARLSTTTSSLPGAIQSSLLNVGMRVRKSVPEGYKTHKTMPPSSSQPSETLRGRRQTDGTYTSVVPSTAPPTLVRPEEGEEEQEQEQRSGGRGRYELLPFCGIHSVGGLLGGRAEAVPGLSWSQSSMGEGQEDEEEGEEVFKGRRRRGKRGFDDGGGDGAGDPRGDEYGEGVERELDDFFDDGPAEDKGERWAGQRRIAPMRGRREGRKDGVGVGVRVVGDFDDGDVAFLEPMDVDT